MDEKELYKNSKKGDITLEVRPYLYDLEKLLSEISRKIVKGIKADKASSLEFYITMRYYYGNKKDNNKEDCTINGQAIVTDYDGKLIGRCLLLKSPINSTIFCENIQENIKYKLSNPDHYLPNVIVIAKNILNTLYHNNNKKVQIIEIQANINLTSIPHDPKILVDRPLETINYNNNISKIRLYNPQIIPSIKY